MILIADSGSTKTNWRLIDDGNKIHQYSTVGLNPYFCNTKEISNAIRHELVPDLKPETLNHKLQTFFYGAGCSSKDKCKIVELALKENFRNANIEVHHDLLGAARALCGHEEGIAAILGTGSNSCYYDGKKIVENIPALGYILGDEGSGAYMGKKLIRVYLNKELPKELSEKFDKRFQLSKDDILEAVYNKPHPNRVLGSFSKFLSQNLEDPYVVQLIYSAFEDFFDKRICKYAKHKEVKMSCVGSVGFHFSKILKAVASDNGVTINKIIETPIAALTLYHMRA